jgi:dynein heavy chain
MYGKKYGEVNDSKDKYETGVVKLTETGEVVAKLEDELKIFAVEVEKKKKTADEKAEIVGAEKAKVEAENAIAEEEAAKCAVIKENVEAQMSSVQRDLDCALPLVEKAKEALAGLKVDDFRELKALKKPPLAIEQTFTCVLHLMCKIDPGVPVDNKFKLKTEKPWATALGLMADPNKFLVSLNAYKGAIDGDQVPPNNFKQIRGQLADPEFTPEII